MPSTSLESGLLRADFSLWHAADFLGQLFRFPEAPEELLILLGHPREVR